MDTGHYNCRDYAFTPHFSPVAYTNDQRFRHESFDELEARSRSPASKKPKFPLLKLPLELRQQILSYLLPHTQNLGDATAISRLTDHARNFSAVKKREAKGMQVPRAIPNNNPGALSGGSNAVSNNIVWRRGNIRLFSVCKQLHRECAEMMYGTNTFLLFVTYAEVKFRFKWILPSGVAPTREFQFLESMPHRYMRLVRRVVVNVEHVDGYTGMVKFNVSGKGLAVGLRNRVASLVNALTLTEHDAEDDSAEGGEERSPMSRVTIWVSNGNGALDAIKSGGSRSGEGAVKVNEDIETILEPFGRFRRVGVGNISGAVTDDFARNLEQVMQGSDPVELEPEKPSFLDDAPGVMRRNGVQLCVYGNDMN